MEKLKKVNPLVWVGLISLLISVLLVVFFRHDRPAKITQQDEPLPEITAPAVVMEETNFVAEVQASVADTGASALVASVDPAKAGRDELLVKLGFSAEDGYAVKVKFVGRTNAPAVK